MHRGIGDVGAVLAEPYPDLPIGTGNRIELHRHLEIVDALCVNDDARRWRAAIDSVADVGGIERHRIGGIDGGRSLRGGVVELAIARTLCRNLGRCQHSKFDGRAQALDGLQRKRGASLCNLRVDLVVLRALPDVVDFWHQLRGRIKQILECLDRLVVVKELGELVAGQAER